MKAAERMLRYVRIATDSDEDSVAAPSSARQWDLARVLERELRELGAADVRLADGCYVYAGIPASAGLEDAEPVGFLAHMDTAPSYTGIGVRPVVTKNYDGGPLTLPGSGAVLSPETFPELSAMRGKTLITSDGTTLLGADDKAGIAEIMTMAETLLHTQRPHGPVCIAFTPDEEVGRGAHGFDVAHFGAKVAYTVDGGAPCELEYETFNAAEADLVFHGVAVHPGSAKGIMKNALLMAVDLASRLPDETPANTEGYEGFYHLCRLSGNEAEAKMQWIIRDHDRAKFEARKQTMRGAAEATERKYGAGTVTLALSDTYYNMAEKIRQKYYLVERAEQAIRQAGLEPAVLPVRGGTDGSILSYMGLICPNLGTGGYAFHGPNEHIASEDMDRCTEILLGIADAFARAEQ